MKRVFAHDKKYFSLWTLNKVHMWVRIMIKGVTSVSDPFSLNPDPDPNPDPAKNLNPDLDPDPEEPWIRIQIQIHAIS